MVAMHDMIHVDRNSALSAGSVQAAPESGAPIFLRNPSDKDLQRADGSGRLVVRGSERGTRIIDVFQKSPVRIIFPSVTGASAKEAVLINTGGGVAGGDRLEFQVTAFEGASITVTSQAAEKIYRALDEPARITTTLKVTDGAKLTWLPQETILFNTARICRRTEIEISSSAEILALEWLVFGRSAHGEQMVNGQIKDNWRVRKDGRLIWADSFRVVEDTFPQLYKKAVLSNHKAIATLVYFGDALDRRVEFVRDIAASLECSCAATLVSGLLVVRFAAEAALELRLALHRVLTQFRLELGPGPFQVPKMWSC
jgi:urease accessory protein